MAFPEIDLFYDLLMDRIHMVLSQFFLDKPFTVLINALPRNHEEGFRIEVPRFDDFTLIYAGVECQKKLLGKPKSPSPMLEASWERLHETRKSEMKHGQESSGIHEIELSTETAIVSSKLYRDFKSGDLDLGDVHRVGMGTLTDYFADRNKEGWVEKHPNEEAEFQILSSYFEIENYNYLSVPLIQFSEFDGIVHIIYHREEAIRFVKFVEEKDAQSQVTTKEVLRKWAVGNLIKAISREYEGKILDWGMVGSNKYKEDAIKDAINLAEMYASTNQNSILTDLKNREYYEKHRNYFDERIRLSSEIPQIILAQYRRIATMQILIDSYTHNISAHSLVALEGWYKQRALYHGSGKARLDVADYPLVRRDKSFDHETHQFVRFMLDKGAFWTGLTRDYSFGGKTNSLYSVLWHDFVNNPLYLGTIAYTEGILKLNINITILGNAEKSGADAVLLKKVLADGTWVSIDLRAFQEIMENGSDLNKESDRDYLSGFITKGDKFSDLSDQMKKCNSYFPGGVVGRHAFFTILENEIRNVKHYPSDVLDDMVENGLTLNISIEEENYHRESGEVPEYYKMGVWLKHPVEVTHKMVFDRLHWLKEDIINENHNPRLGGVFQDKVCAAMLFNNSFVSVQDQSSERDKRFYPWIKVGFSKEDKAGNTDFVEDWEMSVRRYFGENVENEADRAAFKQSREFFDQNFEKEDGYYKKFFHIWRGDDLHDYTGDDNLDATWENLARFKFVCTPPDRYRQNFRALREKGIVRILDSPATTLSEAYSAWLKKWLHKNGEAPTNLSYALIPKKHGGAELIWDGKNFRFIGQEKGVLTKSTTHRLQMVHGKDVASPASEECRYRSHGILLQHFCQSDRLANGQMPEADAAEIIETLATKICVFDNRVYKWVKDMNKQKMEVLGCEVYEEQRRKWNKINLEQGGFFKYHFLVVHLSFIERFKNPAGEKYTEETIDKFIDEQILLGAEPPDNFIVVITSGRGRRQWQNTLESGPNRSKNYLSFVTFRPVESLVGAVEQAMSRADDFDMKYLLTKVLIGS